MGFRTLVAVVAFLVALRRPPPPRARPRRLAAKVELADFSPDLVHGDYWRGWSRPAAKRLGIPQAWRWDDN